jgi:hypothetical protein
MVAGFLAPKGFKKGLLDFPPTPTRIVKSHNPKGE